MAKILYGVAGEGSGHSSRAKEIIEHLQREGHSVKVISYDMGYENLRKHFDVARVSGLHLTYKDNEVKYLPTVLGNISKMPGTVKSVDKILGIVSRFRPDIIFSDFEPLSAAAANIAGLPFISIDNQHILTHAKIEYPRKYRREAVAAKMVTRMMMFNAKAYLITTFFKARALAKKVFLFPPILRKEVLGAKPREKNYILVYLTSRFEDLPLLLKAIRGRFVVYGFNINKKDKNIVFKKASQEGFLRDLANCEGVIANAGFSLMTEALYLKKPYLAIPVKAQFEQVLNAVYLEKLGYGKHWDEINKERIESFLYNLTLYKQNLKRYKKEDNSKIFGRIDELIKKFAKPSALR